MVRFLIKRPIAVIMVFIAAVALGLVAYRTLPVSLMPDIPIPVVTVNITYENSSARELENAVLRQLRSQLLQVQHLSEMKSESHDGRAMINLRFDYGTNIDYAFIEVNEKIDGAMNSLPRDLQRPRVIKASATDIPVYYLNLSLKDPDSLKSSGNQVVGERFIGLSEFAETVIRKRIEQLPEVALVDMSGTVSPRLTIEPDIKKMQTLGLSVSQLENILSRNNVNAGNITVREGHYQYNVVFSSVLREKEDVENIFVNASGRIFRLKEIARVFIEPKDRTGMFAANGKPAITMAVIKQAGARLADMKDQISGLVADFEKDYPGIKFEVSQDQTRLLDYSISNLKQNLGQGLLLVILVVFVFLKDIRLPLLIGLSLIISVIVSLLFFSVLKISVNIISLAGLILAVGNMIDNSIVVTDNISQYRERSFPIDDACVKGTGEIIVPQLSSMLVNIAVFLPMIFLSGIAGALLYDEAVSVSVGLSVSYIVGITFMPVVYRLLYNRAERTGTRLAALKEKVFRLAGDKFRRIFDLDKAYGRGLDFTFRRPGLNILIYLLMIPLGLLIIREIKKEKMPEITRTETVVRIDWNESIGPGENGNRVARLLETVKEETVQSNSFIGTQQFMMNRDMDMSPSEAALYISTGSPEAVKRVENEITGFIRKHYGNASFYFEAPVSIFEKLFTSSEPPLVAEISMINNTREPDLPALLELCGELNADPILEGVNSIPLQEQIALEVDLEKLLLYDVTYDALLREIRTALKENSGGLLRSFNRYMPMVFADREMAVQEIIATGGIMNSRNVRIPMNALVTISRSRGLKTITAGKEGEYVPLIFYPEKNRSEKYTDRITGTVKKAGIFDVKFSGSVFSSLKMLKEAGLLLLISVLLLYFILAAQFESLIQPLIVLMEIPIDIAGALLFLYISGHSLNLMSAMGMVIMCGIIITDSILKLDVINQMRKEGYPLMEAIKTGGHRRLRAIIMTSLTSVLAMLPLLFTNDIGSELQKPFSYALIGGMTVGTPVSLFLVPLVYWYIYRKEKTGK